MGDVAMPLVGAEMADGGPELLAPQDRLALVAVMAEPERIGDLRHVGATSARLPPKPLQARTSRPQPIRSTDPSGRATETPSIRSPSAWSVVDGASHRIGMPSASQAARSRSTSSRPERRRQAVHAAARMAGIVEIGDDREGQPVAVGQPFDDRRSAARRARRRARDRSRHSPCAGCRRRTGRACRRCPPHAGSGCPPPGSARPTARWTRGRGVALEDEHLLPGLARGERGHHPAGARADHQRLDCAVEGSGGGATSAISGFFALVALARRRACRRCRNARSARRNRTCGRRRAVRPVGVEARVVVLARPGERAHDAAGEDDDGEASRLEICAAGSASRRLRPCWPEAARGPRRCARSRQSPPRARRLDEQDVGPGLEIGLGPVERGVEPSTAMASVRAMISVSALARRRPWRRSCRPFRPRGSATCRRDGRSAWGRSGPRPAAPRRRRARRRAWCAGR
jgi:hypothetical protein